MAQQDSESSVETLWMLKRQRQAQDFEAMRAGERSQDSMLLFSREIISEFKVTYTREFSWTELT